MCLMASNEVETMPADGCIPGYRQLVKAAAAFTAPRAAQRHLRSLNVAFVEIQNALKF